MAEWFSNNFLLFVFVLIWLLVFGAHYWWLRRVEIRQTPRILWLLAVALLFVGFHQARWAGERERLNVERLTEDFARLYSSEIEESGHWKLPNNAAANDPLYLQLIEKEKQWETLNPDVSDIYTLRKRPDGTNIFIVDSETDYNHNGKYDEAREQRTPIGEVYDKYDEGLEKAFAGHANFDLTPITDRWGTWVSAYVPLKNPSGQPDGVLGVDFEATRFAQDIRNSQLRILWMASAALLVLLASSTLNALLRAQIAERKKTEESLRLLGSAVEQSKDSIIITDAQLDQPGPKIVFVNPGFTQLTGYAAEEVVGKTPRILQGADTERSVLHELKEKLTKGEFFKGEGVNYRKNKTEFQVEWHIAPIRNKQGAITHYVAIQSDITERKRLEQKLIQSQKLEIVGRLAGGVAHEFNNIITAIIGHADLMLEELPKGHELSKSARTIQQAGKRAAGLTRQLLAYSQRQFLRPEKLNINDVVTSMENVIRHLAGKNVDVRIVPAADLYEVSADRSQIEEVITNIVLNAQDAMRAGGKLTLETTNVTFDEESAKRYEELKPGNYAMLAITDTGQGMTSEVKARVFEPFFSTKHITQGAGLGLATSYGTIKQSGGHIGAYSEPGNGTTFRIYLPQFSAATGQPTSSVNPAVPPKGTETILVVEDDPNLLEMASSFLTKLGYQVISAASGAEALKIAADPEKPPIQLLFTDIMLPGMDGLQLSDRLQAVKPGIKVLFTSAYAQNALIHQGLLKPEMPFLEKPFSLLTLAHKVRRTLGAAN